ncbi:MAG: hypothetical protein ABIN58_01425 [candidate division WOR-3 bacterium]
MNADVFAEWLRRNGHLVVRTESSYWFDAGPRVLQAFPYHWVIKPSPQELRALLLGKGIVALRYSTPVDAPAGCISYHAVYEQPDYTLETLDRRSRQNVRTGLRNCRVEPISFERYARDGWLLELDTQDRQGRHTRQREEEWRRQCLTARELPGFEVWGALVDGSLAASLLTFKMGDCCEMILQQCHRQYLNARVNNALTFVVTQTMISRPTIKSVFYALHSLDAPCSVDEFKFRMGYTAKPVRQCVVFHPWLRPLANDFAHSATVRLLRCYPGNRALAKAEGVLRFHLQGRRSLDAQDWPECLMDRKCELCETSKFDGKAVGVQDDEA